MAFVTTAYLYGEGLVAPQCLLGMVNDAFPAKSKSRLPCTHCPLDYRAFGKCRSKINSQAPSPLDGTKKSSPFSNLQRNDAGEVRAVDADDGVARLGNPVRPQELIRAIEAAILPGEVAG